MSTNVTNQKPYLRTSREFPEDLAQLAKEVTKAYIDTANVCNERVIGVYAKNRASINGKSFFFENRKQQGLQQLYSFTAAGNIPHGLNFNGIALFSTAYGSYTDGTNYYGVIYGSSVPIAGQVSFYITPLNIVVLLGAGAPAITSGMIVLEYISDV